MSEAGRPDRLTIIWAVDARADLRSIDRRTALDILHCVDRFLVTRNGDIKKLKPPMTGFRLRCGEFRIFFKPVGDEGISILGVRHRRDAYR